MITSPSQPGTSLFHTYPPHCRCRCYIRIFTGLAQSRGNVYSQRMGRWERDVFPPLSLFPDLHNHLMLCRKTAIHVWPCTMWLLKNSLFWREPFVTRGLRWMLRSGLLSRRYSRIFLCRSLRGNWQRSGRNICTSASYRMRNRYFQKVLLETATKSYFESSKFFQKNFFLIGYQQTCFTKNSVYRLLFKLQTLFWARLISNESLYLLMLVLLGWVSLRVNLTILINHFGTTFVQGN